MAGNVICDGTYTYIWDAESHLAAVYQSGSPVSLNTYNALGQRVEDITQSSTTDEAYGAGGNLLLRYTGDSNSRSFVPFAGGILAEYYCGGMIFDHPDEIGSLTTATNCAGNVVQERLSYPFGESWNGAGSSGMHQEFAQLPDYDPETDQYNTLARHYSPSGRWMSPDPGGEKVVKLDDPQSWNMYAYVRNNPTTLTDPSGESWWTDMVSNLHLPWTIPHQAGGDPPPELPPPPPPIPTPVPGAPKWEYSQSTGQMSLAALGTETKVGQPGYAGHNQGLNNPANQNVPEDKTDPKNDNAGPLPQGDYTIQPLRNNVIITADGREVSLPASMRLKPDDNNQMFDRGRFLIHGGDYVKRTSSQGCPVERPEVREVIGTSGIRDLKVVP